MNIREWTLPVYTILTQLAAGALLVLWVIRTLGNSKYGRGEVDWIIRIPILIILITVIAGITGAHFHLSRPYLSFLALRNFHTSWLSRELVFNLFFIFAVGCLCTLLWFGNGHNKLITVLGWVAILFGFATDYCMSRVYLLPSQPAWNSPLTSVSFLETTLLLGVMTVPVLLIMDLKFSKSQQQENQSIRPRIIQGSFDWLAVIAVVMVIVIAVLNYFQISSLRAGNESAQTSLGLLLELYQPLLVIRYALLFVGVGWLGSAVVLSHSRREAAEELVVPVFIACLLVMIAEILGRFLFFAIHVRIGI
jgi:anaerobic dimethyl sulfoxide reductase subunit C (anchor subunit)